MTTDNNPDHFNQTTTNYGLPPLYKLACLDNGKYQAQNNNSYSPYPTYNSHFSNNFNQATATIFYVPLEQNNNTFFNNNITSPQPEPLKPVYVPKHIP